MFPSGPLQKTEGTLVRISSEELVIALPTKVEQAQGRMWWCRVCWMWGTWRELTLAEKPRPPGLKTPENKLS